MPTITPHLWYDQEAEQAAELYCSIFPNSRILERHRYEDTGPGRNETATSVSFEISGQRVLALSAGPAFKPDEAFSFFVECDSQDEVDEYWAKLIAEGGQESMCGWLKDRFGVSWQIIPKLLGELMNDEDPVKAKRVMDAMLKMRKIDSDALLAAYEQPVGV